MKLKKVIFIILSVVLIAFSACGSNLVEMQTYDDGKTLNIVWDGRIYKPFCVVSKSDCGKKIGYINGDKNNVVCEYKDYSSEEWIANYLTMDGGVMLCKEISVTEIPDGLEAEYD